MPAPLKERFDVLGLSPSDMLQLHRVCLLVEGHHDQLVLDGLIGDRLASLGVLIQPLHGARHLASVADAQLLSAFTEMPVVALLDNARSDVISSYWAALAATDPSDTQTLDSLPAEHFGKQKQTEEGFITTLGRRLHELGRLDRFAVFGLAKKDIPMYLPVNAFVPGAEDWEPLWNEHQRGKIEQRKNWPKDFKKWLMEKHGASFDDDTIRSACAQAPEIPGEFLTLLSCCRDAGRRRGWSRTVAE